MKAKEPEFDVARLHVEHQQTEKEDATAMHLVGEDKVGEGERVGVRDGWDGRGNRGHESRMVESSDTALAEWLDDGTKADSRTRDLVRESEVALAESLDVPLHVTGIILEWLGKGWITVEEACSPELLRYGCTESKRCMIGRSVCE